MSASGADWEYLLELGVEAATVAFWDESQFPVSHRLHVDDPTPEPPAAVVSCVGDDIDAGVFVKRDSNDITQVRLVFVDDVDELELTVAWTEAGELHLPSGHLVLADPYCSPQWPYRQELAVRPGRWRAEELNDGSLEAVRLTWLGDLPLSMKTDED